MKKIMTTILMLSILFSVSVTAQSKENLKAINTVWAKFYEAFETLDHTLMAEIHSKDLVRISGGRNIIDYNTYINNYKIGFERDKEAGNTSNIELSFFERINNNSTASERGVYKLTRNKGTEKEQSYYGQFHVIFKKSDGIWKITMDYDSSESGTIGEDDFEKAFPIDSLEEFVKN